MAYTLPTAAELKARLPVFASVDDALITLAIAEASRFVDTSWLEVDYAPAIMYLTAHNLVMEGVLNPEGQAPSGVSSGQVTSERLGDAAVTYGNVAEGLTGSEADYARTPYGVRFARMRRGNHAGAYVV